MAVQCWSHRSKATSLLHQLVKVSDSKDCEAGVISSLYVWVGQKKERIMDFLNSKSEKLKPPKLRMLGFVKPCWLRTLINYFPNHPCSCTDCCSSYRTCCPCYAAICNACSFRGLYVQMCNSSQVLVPFLHMEDSSAKVAIVRAWTVRSPNSSPLPSCSVIHWICGWTGFFIVLVFMGL